MVRRGAGVKWGECPSTEAHGEEEEGGDRPDAADERVRRLPVDCLSPSSSYSHFVEWLERVVREAFPNMQFIVTTHSHLVISSASRDLPHTSAILDVLHAG